MTAGEDRAAARRGDHLVRILKRGGQRLFHIDRAAGLQGFNRLFRVQGGGRSDRDHLAHGQKRVQVIDRLGAELSRQRPRPVHIGVEHRRKLDIGEGSILVRVIAAEHTGADDARL
jgi:hypothetical protein